MLCEPQSRVTSPFMCPPLPILMQFIYRFTWRPNPIKPPPRIVKTSALEEELHSLLKVIAWPLPPVRANLQFSTHPQTSAFSIIHPRATYVVGEKLEVLVTAKDHRGRLKSYGGDFFYAKLHSPSMKAAVSGLVTDHHNGSYTASFILQWPGETMVSIKLVHSSEAIAILHEKRATRPDKFFFHGYFIKNGTEEVVECNVDLPEDDVCEYYNEHYEERWVCQRPKTLPCDSYRDHSSGGVRDVFTEEEQEFLTENLIGQEISSTVKNLNVLLQNNIRPVHRPCSPGLQTRHPSGFYYQDVWISLLCSNQHFYGNNVAKCLSGKMIYMFGDSTLRGWWEHLVRNVPTLVKISLHVPQHPGPLLATDAEHDYLVHFRAHQKPLRMERTRVEELHYMAEELDGLGAREGMVIVLTCWAHFSTYPIEVYIHRLWHIRKAVTRLLERSPDTKIFIKSANTGHDFVLVNDWLSYQMDLVMRAMFSELPVTILDVWEMTSCHRQPEFLHPEWNVVKNEVDLMLSFLCP
ncbi:NXPE family member 3-like [Hyla sarda]|uniref:NXPE family member 3-like n=1 Tax=Hyla sarda TaxID=327740 RepID=UPI0024C2E841|nr:NXPE family member 3-like [Hyla sarda]